MIICKNCNSTLHNNAKFCKECGAQVPDNIKFCNNCHCDVPENAKFCEDCGNKLKIDSSRPISALLVFLMFIGSILVVYRSVDFSNDKNLPISIQSINKTSYDEVSFHTLVFRGQPRNEIRLNVYSPTTQAIMIDSAKEWLNKNTISGKIKDADETIINIYEVDKEKNSENERAEIIQINLELNKSYNFPKKGNFESIGKNIFVSWLSKDNMAE